MDEREVEGLAERLRRAIRLVEEWRVTADAASGHAKRLEAELERMTTAKEWWRRAAWGAVGEEMPEVGVHVVEPGNE